MSDHAPQAVGTDIKCRLNEIKCVLSNLLSVYTMYTDNIPLTTCCSISFSMKLNLRSEPVPQTCAIYGA